MKSSKFITLLVAFLAVGCTMADVDLSVNGSSDGKICISARVKPFADCDVTRANKTDGESRIYTMDYVIFGTDDNCVFYQHLNAYEDLVLDRKTSFTGIDPSNLTNCKIYILANYPGFSTTYNSDNPPLGKTLAELATCTTAVGDVTKIPSSGLPMIGGVTTYDDGSAIDLSEDGSVPAGHVFTIPMESLYAKIVFNINVNADQVVQTPAFTLTGYEVHNVAATLDSVGGTESSYTVSWGEDSHISAFTYTAGSNDSTECQTDGTNTDEGGNTYYKGAARGEVMHGGTTPISFSFYLPERFLSPSGFSADYAYDFGKIVGLDEDEFDKLPQRYKPTLVANQTPAAATFVRIFGTYVDHIGISWDISYDIYVGNDNFCNFDIVRNTQYNNNITIRGALNSADAEKATISVDHRVNIKRTQPAIISLRRETLLDSHFEVRPLRVRKSSVSDGDINAVQVTVNDDAQSWIGVERSFGYADGETSSTETAGGDYLISSELADDRKSSAGKRRYFTTDLTTSTLKGKSVVVPIPTGDSVETVWIYVDECTEVGDAVRTGYVTVTYGKYEDGSFTETTNTDYPPVEYVLNQRKLFEVTYTDSDNTTYTYLIEYEEEYLHNFDADDSYGTTEYEGMQWGLNGVQLSYKDGGHISYVSSTGTWADGFKDVYIKPYAPYYDFYVKKHDSLAMTNEDHLHNRKGYDFFTEIIAELNNNTERNDKITSDTDTTNDIGILSLAEVPNSAVEYCYNRNKRNADGTISTINWYLPAIDQMEDIIMGKYGTNSVYSRFDDFQNKFYWSSQPAYYKNHFHYSVAAIGTLIAQNDWGYLYIDNTQRARATRVKYTGTFDYEPSGSDGYYSVILIDGDMSAQTYNQYFLYKELESKTEFSYIYDYVKIWNYEDWETSQTYTKDDLPTFETGNRPRTSMARVRCVRKMTTATE